MNWDGGEKWEEFELPAEIANRRYQFTGAVCDGNKIRFLTIQDGKSFFCSGGQIISKCAAE